MNRIARLVAFIPCHRRPDRSIHIQGRPFPLCARCMSICLGFFFIPLLFLLPVIIPFWIGVVCQLPMIVDGVTQQTGWRESNQPLRITTGLLSGVGLSVGIVAMSKWLVQWLQALS